MKTKIELEEGKKKKTECTLISMPCHADLQPSSGGMLKRRRQRYVRKGVRMKIEIESEDRKKENEENWVAEIEKTNNKIFIQNTIVPS